MTMPPHFLHHLLRLTLPLLALALALLAACSTESTERQAFAEFLQTRILDKPGVRVPKLNDEEKKRLGRYVAHYQVIVDHNDDDTIGKSLFATLTRVERIRTLGALMDAGATIGEARSELARYRQQWADQLEQTERARATLIQPDDLKAVFDAAYRRTVTDPVGLVDTQFGLIDELLTHYEELVAYLDANRAVIRVSGGMAEVDDPHVQAQLQARMTAIEALQGPLAEIDAKLRKAIYGT